MPKIRLDFWRSLLEEPFSKTHQDLAQNWKSCAIGERIEKEGKNFTREEDLMPESRVLGHDFFLAVKKRKKHRARELLEIIETRTTVWKKNTKYPQRAEMISNPRRGLNG